MPPTSVPRNRTVPVYCASARPLLSGWLILYQGGWGGLRVGGWVCLGFPRYWEKCRYPPQGGGGVRFVGWVGGLLSLVDRQHCSWAEAHCDTGCCHLVQTCFALHFCNGHHFHFSLYMVLKHGMAGTVSDPVIIAQASQMKGVSPNPALHSSGTCYGVVNLKLLCDPPPPQGIRQVGGWV